VFTYKNDDSPTNGFTTTPAAHYFIKPYPAGNFAGNGQAYALKAIYYERQVELAMEGHRFFDVVRWGIADQALNAYLQYESKITTDLPGAHFTSPKNNYFPIPLTQIDLMVKGGKSVLVQNPGYN
jgi:hypothetical protein